MKTLCLALSLATLAGAQTITPAEREKAVSYLKRTGESFVQAVAGLSEAQWNFKPAPERWSIAECAEHIAITEDTLFGGIERALRAPATPEKKELVKDKDDLILRVIPDRSRKAVAPEVVQPKRRWPDQQELVEHFRQSRARTVGFISRAQVDLRSHFFPHFVLKDLDAYQWFLFIAAHCDRHIQQLNEVKTDPGYPK